MGLIWILDWDWVFIVPIRDWNLTEAYNFFKEWKSFYRPYKGLKHKKELELVKKENGFYRPYKGLKPNIQNAIAVKILSFYRPYKGLKHEHADYVLDFYVQFLSSL